MAPQKRIRQQCSRCRFNPWVGKSPRGGNGNPLQYSCLKSPMDRGTWWATVHGVAKVLDRNEHAHTAQVMQDLTWPGIRPIPPAVEAQNLNHWTAREVPVVPCVCINTHGYIWHIYLSIAASGLSCKSQDLWSSLWCAGTSCSYGT